MTAVDPAAHRCRRWTLLVVCGVSAVLLFNVTAVTAPNVALPDIGRSLGSGFVALQWVLSSYALVLAALLLAGGALGDRHGHRTLFLAGLAVFTAGSTLCAAAPGEILLVAGRVVQGVGAAALFPAGLALIAAEFAGAARARAIGVWAATVAAAIALGPLLGGLLVQAAGWRAQFVTAAVLALPAIVLGRRHLRGSDAAGPPVDWLGTGLLSGALFLAVLVLTTGNDLGWASPATIGAGGLALALLAAFVLAEHRVAAPLISPSLMRNRTFVAATLVALIFAAAGFAPLTYIAQFLLASGAGPVGTGLAIAPFAVAAFVVSLLAARVTARLGLRLTLAGGLAVGAVGLALLIGLDPGTSAWALLPGLLVFGVGAGVVNPAMTTAALAVVPAEQGGMASAVNNAARQFGIASGIAGLGALVQARLGSGVAAELALGGTPPDRASAAGARAASGDLAAATAAAGRPASVVEQVVAAAYTGALDAVFLAGIAISLLGVIIVLLVVRTDSSRPAG